LDSHSDNIGHSQLEIRSPHKIDTGTLRSKSTTLGARRDLITRMRVRRVGGGGAGGRNSAGDSDRNQGGARTATGPAVCRCVTAVRGAVPSRQVHIAGFLSLTRRIGRQQPPPPDLSSRVFSKYTPSVAPHIAGAHNLT